MILSTFKGARENASFVCVICDFWALKGVLQGHICSTRPPWMWIRLVEEGKIGGQHNIILITFNGAKGNISIMCIFWAILGL